MIRRARLADGNVVHLVRWVGTAKWRSECNRVAFGWSPDGSEVGQSNNYGSTPRPAIFDVLDRPLCSGCLARIEADRRQVAAWRDASPGAW